MRLNGKSPLTARCPKPGIPKRMLERYQAHNGAEFVAYLRS